MTNNSPYATPSELNQDSEKNTKRPVWVWIISVFHVFIIGLASILYFLVPSGTLNILDKLRQSQLSFTVFDHAQLIAMQAVSLVAYVQFFRLKKVSAYLLLAIFVVYDLFRDILPAITNGLLTSTSGGSVTFGSLLGWLTSIAVCAYAWWLRKTGVLK